jgi:DNA ligase-1
MQAFCRLYTALDETNATNAKVAVLVNYFQGCPPASGAWAVYFLCGRRLKRLISSTLLRQWVTDNTGLPAWLVEESYAHVGDLAETLALLTESQTGSVGSPGQLPLPLHQWIEERLEGLRGLDTGEQRAAVTGWWAELPSDQRFVLNKLLTGALRVGVSRSLVVRALAQVTDLPATVIAQRLTGQWQPSAEFYEGLLSAPGPDMDPAQPYPFFLASPLEGDPTESLGERDQWLAEWKWDGIRAQVVRRGGCCHIWSRGEESMDGRFPELEAAAAALPEGTVLDGEVLAWGEQGPLPFSLLQKRIGRLRPDSGLLKQAPLRFLAYDLLENEGTDIRQQALRKRRARLRDLLSETPGQTLELSAAVAGESWGELARRRSESRQRGVEGLVLKRLDSSYRVGRRRGSWWKWKIDPYTLDAVLIYAQPGHGRRANLYTDYTFAVWRDGDLVPIAKAYSGLDQNEIERLDRWIRRHTTERFGPVRAVQAEQVFELAFEGISRSSRHKSGLALRFPRIARWRTDLGIQDADRLADLQALAGPGDP